MYDVFRGYDKDFVINPLTSVKITTYEIHGYSFLIKFSYNILMLFID